ncbi:MAG: nicotinate (nicotinamide) nucleotide adenylyltransferase [Burkholderiales bacterium]|nr:nicotinate (nicotinamide) nucleotide adenylyltransferase [Burkholderiales bacterium]
MTSSSSRVTGSEAGPRARRVGIFGGSFDPPHAAHAALARVACDTLTLDELRWIPVGQAWQKARRLADGGHRRAMVAALLAEAGDARQLLDERELRRPGPSYTRDTLAELHREAAGQPTAWFLIIGQDQYANLPTWQGWRDIVAQATLAVAARAGAQIVAPPELAAVPHRLVRLPLPAMPVSSTEIRARLAGPGAAVASGEPARALVPTLLPASVAGYIDQHNLYRESDKR